MSCINGSCLFYKPTTTKNLNSEPQSWYSWLCAAVFTVICTNLFACHHCAISGPVRQTRQAGGPVAEEAGDNPPCRHLACPFCPANRYSGSGGSVTSRGAAAAADQKEAEEVDVLTGETTAHKPLDMNCNHKHATL